MKYIEFFLLRNCNNNESNKHREDESKNRDLK